MCSIASCKSSRPPAPPVDPSLRSRKRGLASWSLKAHTLAQLVAWPASQPTRVMARALPSTT
uniref:Uncharacterized protein n=1 Tax=Arundo donax TaxID=35708 RepID=A0A0A8YHM7_ARUDO